MKNTINFSLFNKAAQFRTSNPLLNGILLLFVLIALPLLLIFGIATIIIIAVIARFRTISQLYRPQPASKATNTVHFEKHNSVDDREGFAEYEIVDEKIGH